MSDNSAPLSLDTLRINIDDIISIFQLNDRNLFSPITGKEEKQICLLNMFHVADSMGSRVPDHLGSPDKLRDTEVFVYGEPQSGPVINVAKYTYDDENGVEQTGLTITIALCSQRPADCKEGPEFTADPAFACNFLVDPSTDTLRVIDCFVRSADQGENVMLHEATDQHDFYAFMLYADYVFTTLVQKKTFSLEDTEKFFTPDFIKASLEPYKNIIARTKFDTYLLAEGHAQTDEQCLYDRAEWNNVFLLEESNIYYEVEGDEKGELKERLREMVNILKSDYAWHFSEDIEFTSDPLLYVQSDDGSSFWSIPYTTLGAFGIPEKYHILLLCQSAKDAGEDIPSAVRPIGFILTRNDPENGTLEPLEAICAVQKDDDDDKVGFLSFKTPQSFIASLCYMEEGLKSVFSGRIPQPKELSQWFRRDNGLDMMEHYNHLSERTAEGFMRDAESPPLASQNPPSQRTLSAMTIPQGYKLH